MKRLLKRFFPHCSECNGTLNLQQWAGGRCSLHICADCAGRIGYLDYMPSLRS